MKLAVNTLIFGLNQAVAEGLSLAEAAGIDGPLAYDVLTASAAGAPLVAYKRAAFLEPETTPGRVLARPGREGPAAHRRPSPRPSAWTCRRRERTCTRSRRPPRRAAATATSPPSRVPRGPPPSGAEEDRADRHRGRGRPARRPSTRDRRSSTEEAAMSERTLIKDAIVLSIDPDIGELPRASILIEDGKIAAVGPNVTADGAKVIDADRRHRHPGLHRHPPPHLGDVDPDLRAGLRADHLLRVHPRQVRAALPPRRRAGREPLGRARVASTRASRRWSTGRTS